MSDIVKNLKDFAGLEIQTGLQPLLDDAAAEITRLRAENERLSKAMTDLLWYVAQLETLVYDKDDAGEHESVTRARAALKENSDE